MRAARYNFFLPVIISLAVLSLDLIGLFDPWNNRLADLAQRLPSGASPSVVIVEQTSTGNYGPADWARVVASLRRAGADRVVFTFDPFGLLPLPADPSVLIVGEAALRGSDGEWRLADPRGPARPVAIVPPADYGIHRAQLGAIVIGGTEVPTIEAAVVGESAPARFVINFSLARGPRLSAERVAAGQLANGMLRGKIALVGPPDAVGEPRLATPLSPSHATARPVDLHAAAIETLRAGEAIRIVGPIIGGLLVLGTCLAATPLYARVSVRRAPLALAAALVLTIAIGFIILWTAERLMPVYEIATAQLLLAPLFWRQRRMTGDAQLASFVRRAGARVEGDRVRLQENWPAFAAATARLLGVERQLIVRRRSDGSLEQLSADKLSVGDLPDDETTRRALLNAADAARAPILMPSDQIPGKRLYIASLAPEEADGGYWVYSRPTDELADGGIKALRARLAELLILADTSSEREHSDRSRLETQVTRTVDRLERRGALLAGALASISGGVAVFDAAGLLVQTNGRMDKLMRAAELEPGRATMVDLVVAFADIDEEQATKMLRRVAQTRAALGLPVTRELDGRRWLLRLATPLVDAVHGTGELLCELVDVSEVSRLAELRRDLATHLDMSLRNDFEAVQLAARLAADPRMTEAQRARALDRLNAAVVRARDKLGSLGAFLAAAGGGPLLEPYPIDPLGPVNAALADIAADFARARLDIAAKLPTLAAPVIAEPETLRSLVGAILALIVRDSREGDRLAVEMEELVGHTCLQLAGGSFGLPEERLRTLVEGVAEASAEFGAIAKGAQALREWGGTLVASGGADTGYRFTLTLMKLS